MSIKKMILIMILLSASLTLANQVYAVEPHPANAMWIEPSTLDITSLASEGYRFNVTVWANASVETRGWQIWLLYEKANLNATNAWLCMSDGSGSASGPSEFMADAGSVMPVTPQFIDYNSTHDRVDFGEAWIMGANASAKAGRCAYVEFEVVALPPEGELVEISLGIKWAYELFDPPKTYVLVQTGTYLSMDVYDGLVIIPEFTPLMLLALLALTTTIVLYIRKKNH